MISNIFTYPGETKSDWTRSGNSNDGGAINQTVHYFHIDTKTDLNQKMTQSRSDSRTD